MVLMNIYRANLPRVGLRFWGWRTQYRIAQMFSAVVGSGRQ